MSINLGSFLGPYEITALLGKGGMGEVYRARDTKLKREVAIKILPEEFSSDAERLARFQREAETLAALNHQNIAAIYDLAHVGNTRFLVLELVEGQTLSEVTKAGAMRLDDALRIAGQICDALEAAHEKGIVHRDLKPENVKLTPNGKVKVLDFGLAKAFQQHGPNADLSDSPTVMSTFGPAGIVGTPGYMSPEQVRGEAVDKRADVWAFGVLLWEMVTGKRLYEGKTLSDVLAAVIREEPDLSRAPAKVRPLLKRCLQKEPQQRLRDIGDAMAIVDNTPEIQPASSRAVWGLATVAAVFAAAFGILMLVHLRETRPELRTLTTSIEPPENTRFDFEFNVPALSPDGRRIVFAVRGTDGKSQLWMRSLDSPASQPLAGTDNAQFPFWSPDSRSVGFFSSSKLKRIDADGGPVLTLADAPNPRGGSWSSRGVIVFAPNVGGQLQRVPASGGTPTPATSFDAGNDYSHSFPWFLSDGNHFLFEDQSQAGISGVTLRIAALDSQQVQTVGAANSNGVYANGYLIYLRENTLMAQPFDEKRLSMDGEAQPIAEQVRNTLTPNSIGIFTVARDGLLAYESGESEGQQLTWFSRSGKPVATLGEVGGFLSLDLSPDGKSVAATRLDENNDIWIYDAERGLANRFTVSREVERDAVWTPDGKSIVYRSNAKGSFDLYRKAADGTGIEELLHADGAPKIASSVSPDGDSVLFYRIDPKTQRDIWLLRRGDSKPIPWLLTPANESFARFSPDGQWVAYASDESGRYEVYVAPFPGPGGKRQISTEGTRPRWRADGKEIFYVGPRGMITAAALSIKGNSIEVGEIRSLGISVPASRPGLYDVSADGQRFLVAAPAEQKSTPLALIQNWTARLKK